MQDDKTNAPSPNELTARADAVYDAMAVMAGMKLDVFSQLQQGPLDGAAIAERLKVERSRLVRLLYALVNANLLTVENKLFANTPVAQEFLVRGKPRYMGSIHELWTDLWTATFKTAETVRSGIPQARHDFENASPEELGAFFRGLHAGAKSAGNVLAEVLDFTRCESILDVGGGSGGLAIGACERLQGLKATVAELPDIVSITQDFIVEEGMADRIDVKAVNLVSEQLSSQYDIAILRYILQTLSATEAASVLRNLNKSVRPGGEIHILGYMLDDSRLAPSPAVNFDIVFLNIYDEGGAYTVGEHKEWLEAAGFDEIKFVPAPQGTMPSGTMMASARKS